MSKSQNRTADKFYHGDCNLQIPRQHRHCQYQLRCHGHISSPQILLMSYVTTICLAIMKLKNLRCLECLNSSILSGDFEKGLHYAKSEFSQLSSLNLIVYVSILTYVCL
jgi:hypothetical protein